MKESSEIVWWFPNFFISLRRQTENTMVRKRTLRERITQLGRICNTEAELMKQRNQHGIMTRANIAKHILWKYEINIFGCRGCDLECDFPRYLKEIPFTNAQYQGKQDSNVTYKLIS